MRNKNMAISRGNVTTGGSSYYPWPNQWPTYPHHPWNEQRVRIYPTTTVVSAPPEEYANEVEVERGDHDAVIRFYRKREKSRSLVKEVTVPLSLLDWLTSP